jgi:hypothetical protein
VGLDSCVELHPHRSAALDLATGNFVQTGFTTNNKGQKTYSKEVGVLIVASFVQRRSRRTQNVLEPILKVIGARKLRELTAADVRRALASMATPIRRRPADPGPDASRIH